MGNLLHKTVRAVGAGAAAATFALLSISSQADAAPVDLASFGLTAAESEWLGGAFTVLPPDGFSPIGLATATIGSISVQATGDASAVTLTLTDLGDFSGLNASSVALGYADDGSFADALFTVTSATGAFGGLSSSLYAVLELPDDISGPFFTANARLYQTGDLTDPNVVPLPATGLLLLGALAGTGVFTRRRR